MRKKLKLKVDHQKNMRQTYREELTGLLARVEEDIDRFDAQLRERPNDAIIKGCLDRAYRMQKNTQVALKNLKE